MFSILGGLLTGGLNILKTVMTWLLANPAILFALAFSVAFLFTVDSKNSEIATLQAANKAKDDRINGLYANNVTLKTNNASLSSSLSVQTASITALQAQGTAADEKFNQLIAGQAASNASIAKKISTIDAATPGADKCSSAFDLIRSSVQ